ncbi:TadE family type IV pilus minor pilin [Nocardioides campestrisoli]|uniref:TadE family type IV pilus minor pilin n=1 Tax=Nocardioides campestrisoli TaxID=2736757 RepID=UPI0021E17C45|nr:TadE family type IV pilus minor pilin [Nocardioides campestrisoli]
MTAELAMGIPVLLAVVLALVWMLSLGVAQLRVVDAAREVARALARGESEARAREWGGRVAPPGARIDVGRSDGLVVVRVRAILEADGLLGALPGARLQAEAVAAEEEGEAE